MGTFAKLFSVVAAGMNTLLVIHYYQMVYLKGQEEPHFTMAFKVKGDGGASFAEYTIFTAAVVGVSAMATPSSFRFSSRALLMGLEGLIAGFLLGLITLEGVIPDPIGVLMKVEHAPLAFAAVMGLLGLVLLARFFGNIGLNTFVHLVFVVVALRPVVETPQKNFTSGSSDVVPAAVLLEAAKAKEAKGKETKGKDTKKKK